MSAQRMLFPFICLGVTLVALQMDSASGSAPSSLTGGSWTICKSCNGNAPTPCGAGACAAATVNQCADGNPTKCFREYDDGTNRPVPAPCPANCPTSMKHDNCGNPG